MFDETSLLAAWFCSASYRSRGVYWFSLPVARIFQARMPSWTPALGSWILMFLMDKAPRRFSKLIRVFSRF